MYQPNVLHTHAPWTHFKERVPGNVSLDDALKPETWRHIEHWKVGDLVELQSETLAFHEICVVRKVLAGGGAVLVLLKELSADSAAVEERAKRHLTERADKFVIGWGGPKHKFRIVDESVNPPAVVKFGFSSEAEARDSPEFKAAE